MLNIDNLIANMTLDDMIGQMFMGNICGGETVEFAARNFERYHFGALQFSGVFERFIRGGDYLPCGVCRLKPPAEMAEFIHQVKAVGREITGLPVMLAGDQEGSISNSIFRNHYFATMPFPMGFGAAASPELAYRAAVVTAREVKTMGLDMLYGPSLDVLTNPENPEIAARSFSQQPEAVAALGLEVIKAYAEEGVISNIKHFPGRGFGSHDAHRELESIPLARGQLLALAVHPFKRALEAGADSVMLAHTLYPALEPERLPASLSPRIVTGLLREELGFDGLVLPDDLTMFAISHNFGIPQAAAMCLEAGADMIFMKVPEEYAPSIAAVKESLRTGRLTEERLIQSVRRILALKLRKGHFTPSAFSAAQVSATIGCAAHVAVAREAANRALLVVKNVDHLLPLNPLRAPSMLAVVQRDMHVVLANDPLLTHELLPQALREHYPAVQSVLVETNPAANQIFEAVGRAKNVDIVVAGIYSGGLSEEYRQLLAELTALGKPVIVVITNSPGAALHLPDGVAAIVHTFGISSYAFQAAAAVIAGALHTTATSPVSLVAACG